jgi:hypothetical protein
MATSIAIHGNAVSVAEAPGDLENVNGIGWTDIVGLRQGWGATFRGKARRFVWFHYTIPTMSIVNNSALALSRLNILFDVAGQARVDSVHVWNNSRQRIVQRDNLGQTRDFVVDFSPTPVSLASDIGISLGVFFSEATNITFRGLIVELLPTTPPPPPLDATFSGTATLRTTHGNAMGPFMQSIGLSITFTGDRPRNVRLNGFPPIVVTFPVPDPWGTNTTTVTLLRAGTGTFDPLSGRLDLPVTLLFTHSVGCPFACPSQADFNFTTETSTSPSGAFNLAGARRDPATGNITVVGNNPVQRGVFYG